MISADPGVVLFYAGLFLGVVGRILRCWEIELKQVLPRYEKRNRVEQGGSR